MMSNESLQQLTTASGERFCAMGIYPPPMPAPVVLILAADAFTTLESDDFNRSAKVLAAAGALCVSIDVPCHGRQRRKAEAPELHGWRERIEQGDPLVDDFIVRAQSLLDELIQDGIADATRIAVAGTSRGGFLALHLASRNKRVSRVVAYAPVTDLMALDEFKSTTAIRSVQSMALHHRAMALVERDIWICVGRRDPRIDEQRVVSLANAVKTAAEAMNRPVRLELHRYDADEHTMPPSEYAAAANWLLSKLRVHLPLESA